MFYQSDNSEIYTSRSTSTVSSTSTSTVSTWAVVVYVDSYGNRISGGAPRIYESQEVVTQVSSSYPLPRPLPNPDHDLPRALLMRWNREPYRDQSERSHVQQSGHPRHRQHTARCAPMTAGCVCGRGR